MLASLTEIGSALRLRAIGLRISRTPIAPSSMLLGIATDPGLFFLI
jgi:hypothetical protein